MTDMTPDPMDRLCARFEIAVSNFGRSCLEMRGNEKAFQAWYAACVIQEFGLSRVYREVHLDKRQLERLTRGSIPDRDLPRELTVGNELFPDLSISWEPDIDARHTNTRDAAVADAGDMLQQFGILSELKVTGSTGKSTPLKAIRQDLIKLGLFMAAHKAATKPPPARIRGLAAYLVIMDNHKKGGSFTSACRRMDELIPGKFSWPPSVPRPRILVISAGEPGPPRCDVYQDFTRLRSV